MHTDQSQLLHYSHHPSLRLRLRLRLFSAIETMWPATLPKRAIRRIRAISKRLDTTYSRFSACLTTMTTITLRATRSNA